MSETVWFPDCECGGDYKLTPGEEALVKIFFWARNKKKTLDFCNQNQFYPGPSGHKDKKGVWWPSTSESCDAILDRPGETVDKGDAQNYLHPWRWFIHCKSLQHITYLVKHRMSYLRSSRFCEHGSFSALFKIVKNGENLLGYEGSKDILIKMYVEDNLKLNRFEILKRNSNDQA